MINTSVTDNQAAHETPHWMPVRLRYIWRLKGGTGFPDDEQGIQGEDFPFFKVKHLAEADADGCLRFSEHTVSRGTATQLGAFIFPTGTIVFAKVGAALLLNRFRFIGQASCIDNNMMGLVLDGSRVDKRFMLHRLAIVDFGQIANPGAVPSLNAEQVAEQAVLLPPLPTQRAIADYLDRETERIDALVAAKERVLGLLAEKRRALITRAVTRGLDPLVPLRDSGIPWLGEIPGHWEATRLKFVAEVRGGLALGKNYGSAKLCEYAYLRVTNVQDGHLDLTDIAKVLVPQKEAESCFLETGDVLMNEGGDADKLGRGCIWSGEILSCLHQNHVFAVSPRRVASEWLNIWTSAEGAKTYFESRAKQSTNLASISTTNIKELPIPLPPADEQKAIVAHIATETAKLDALRSATERTITLLKERRAALIAAAVTGRIETSEVIPLARQE